MTASVLVLTFFVLCGLGIIVAAVVPARLNPPVLAIIGALEAALLFIAGAIFLTSNTQLHIELWSLPFLGTMSLASDHLSAIFMLATAFVYMPVSLFSGTYLQHYIGHYNLRYFGVLYQALFAAIALILISGDVLSFLFAWEFMSITSYLLVTFEYERPDRSQACYLMLAMSEAGTLAVIIAFLLLVTSAVGALGFDVLRASTGTVSNATRWVVFLLSFGGFAVKAGLVPVNSWLPRAHPIAPTNISALLSATIVNLGIYGFMRVNLDLSPAMSTTAGLIVLVVGAVSALIGILYATTEPEMKRLLAHSTIENMGIVVAGLGAGMVFMTSGRPVIAGIAFIAATYHMTNHAVYKALLFLGAGIVDRETGTRDIDRLGGLIRAMPWTSAWFLVGVLSISALPPLNGFVGEWLTLQTILRSAVLDSVAIKIVFAVSGALLALTAGLAVTCFAKVFAMGFLGLPRSQGAAQAIESRWSMRAPLALLAVVCILLGISPTYVIPMIDRGIAPLTHQSAVAALVPPFLSTTAQQREALPSSFLNEFHDLGAQIGRDALPGRGLVVLHRGEEANPVVFAMSTLYTLVILAVILATVFLVFQALTAWRRARRGEIWAGGIRHLWPGITYTATGFANPVRVIFDAVLRPSSREDSVEAVAHHFRTAIRREHDEAHITDRLLLNPLISALGAIADVTRRMHVGHVNAYAAYVLVLLLVVLVAGVALH